MRNILTILGLIPWAFAFSQPGDEAVYKSIIDALIKSHEFEFYYNKLQHIETQEYSDNPLDTFVLFNPETYEDVTKVGIDYKVHFDSINLHEAKLFNQRVNYPNGLYLISKIRSSQLHKSTDLKNCIELESYPKVENLSPLSGSIFKSRFIGPYSIMESTKENILNYKYAIKAFLAFSDIVWDKTNQYCLVECGYHYYISDKHPDRGQSGGGFQVILKNESGSPEIIKFIGLWEE